MLNSEFLILHDLNLAKHIIIKTKYRNGSSEKKNIKNQKRQKKNAL